MNHITLKYDGTFDLATHTRPKSKHGWQNRKVTWGELLNKLKEPYYTHETAGQYTKMPKDQQDTIKDVGAFVGGLLAQGRRLKTSVAHRQLLVVDIDFAKSDTWATFQFMYGCAAAVYSTHKHTADKPRLRLLLPLNREVEREEYEAIGRRIAADIDIELFDHTGFQPERFMYWQSTSKDAPYLFEYQDGDWLDADKVLATYHNWEDISEWPLNSRESAVVNAAIKKQGDPLEKPGVIGAFCRTYSITETIDKFLSDVYTPTDKEDRFTFMEGSTAGGFVVYEDKYGFSHHGTDPTSGKLCNAFDLVRTHLFAEKDKNSDHDTPINKLPSFLAMQEFAIADKEVKRLVGQERYEAARGDFEGEEADGDILHHENGDVVKHDTPVNLEWLEQMETDKKTNYLASRKNFKLILENDVKLKGCFAYDSFAKRIIVTRSLPWRKLAPGVSLVGDADIANLRIYMSVPPYNISHNGNLQDALDAVVAGNEKHPVREYLDGLQWDTVSRLERLFVDYMGAADTEYVRTVTRKAFVAAVARIYEPGIKFDNVLTLIGGEGIQKSSIFNKLGGAWFSDSFSFKMIERGKEAFEQLQGYWLIEIPELSGMRKADVETVKHFVAKAFDVYRVPHAAYTSHFPRSCVFFGTTNRVDFLQGVDGNRRFWPIMTEVTKPASNVIKLFTKELVGQLWAEAIHVYRAGEALYLPKDLEQEARTIQAAHTEADDRQGLIEHFLEMELPESWAGWSTYERQGWLSSDEPDREPGIAKREVVTVAEIGCELLRWQVKDMNTTNTKAVHNILKQIKGWSGNTTTRTRLYGKQRAYRRFEAGNEVGGTVKNAMVTGF